MKTIRFLPVNRLEAPTSCRLWGHRIPALARNREGTLDRERNAGCKPALQPFMTPMRVPSWTWTLPLTAIGLMLTLAGTQGQTPPPPEPPEPSPIVEDATPKPESSHVAAPTEAPNGERNLRLNFRNAPLELVLDYLSEAAGFIIVPETDVSGNVDVWSNQPLTTDEALAVLSQVLSRNGYAVLRNGRTLTVVRTEDAKKRDIPVKTGYDPADIPKDDQIVTQIIPVRFVDATQLSTDLAPLMPDEATMTANEAGNALVITDRQINIRRMAEIIKAIDTSVSSLSAVQVFTLKYADAEELADVIGEVFASTEQSGRSGSDPRSRMFSFMGGGPGRSRGGGGNNGSSSSGGRPGASRVIAAADERSNSLIVSAPQDLMPTIEDLVASVDTNVEDITEVRVFRLKYADPLEMADLITNLFPDEDQSSGRSVRFGGPFGGGPPGFGGRGRGSTNDQSDRMKKQSRVLAVADQRTGSVVVTAARELMTQIAAMIEDLDSNPAKKQKVFVYELKNADIQNAEEILRNLFEGQNSRGTTTTSESALESRATQMLQNQLNSSARTTGLGSGNNSGRTGR